MTEEIDKAITVLNDLIKYKDLSDIFDSTLSLDTIKELPFITIQESNNLQKNLDKLLNSIENGGIKQNIKILNKNIYDYISESHNIIYELFCNLRELTSSLSSSKSKIAEISTYYLNHTSTSYTTTIKKAENILSNYYKDEYNLIKPKIDEIIKIFEEKLTESLQKEIKIIDNLYEKIENKNFTIKQANDENIKTILNNLYYTKNFIKEVIEKIKEKIRKEMDIKPNGYFISDYDLNVNNETYSEIINKASQISSQLDNDEFIDTTFDEVMKWCKTRDVYFQIDTTTGDWNETQMMSLFKIVKKYGMLDHVLWESLYASKLRKLYTLGVNPKNSMISFYGNITTANVDTAYNLGCKVFSIQYTLATYSLIQYVISKGMKPYIWFDDLDKNAYNVFRLFNLGTIGFYNTKITDIYALRWFKTLIGYDDNSQSAVTNKEEVEKKANAEYISKGTTLTQTSYSNTNPTKSGKVKLYKLGGMSYKVNDTIQHSAVTQIRSKNGSTIVDSLSIPSYIRNIEGYGWGINDTCYNYIDFANKKFVQKVGRVDLGSLNWQSDNSFVNCFYASVSDKYPSSVLLLTNYENLGVRKYAVTLQNDTTLDKCICCDYNTSSNIVIIKDTTYNNATTFKSAMNGVYLYYELATPIETDISAYLTRDTLECIEGGTLEFLNTYNQAVPNETAYLFNAVTLNNVVDSNGNPRFIEGNGTPATITGFTATQCKWSLSGTHLMLVLAGTIANGTAITSSIHMADYVMPQFIVEKIQTLTGVFIEFKNTNMRASTLGIQNVEFVARKTTTGVYLTISDVTLTADRNFRIQFDLLIDSK